MGLCFVMSLGNIPGRPQGGRHGMVFGQIPAPSIIGSPPVPLVPGSTSSKFFFLK